MKTQKPRKVATDPRACSLRDSIIDALIATTVNDPEWWADYKAQQEEAERDQQSTSRGNKPRHVGSVA